jgi:hypothetical protein
MAHPTSAGSPLQLQRVRSQGCSLREAQYPQGCLPQQRRQQQALPLSRPGLSMLLW